MYYLTNPEEHKGCFNEIVVLDGRNELYNYSLSNNLDDIEVAIYERTGYNIKLNDAYWEINPNLSISVKHLMNKHQVNFSMTYYADKTSKKIIVIVNMRAGGLWFFTGYKEINGRLRSWVVIKAAELVRNYTNKYLSSNDE